jgi:hypothetical protein
MMNRNADPADNLSTEERQRLNQKMWGENGHYVCDYSTWTALMGPMTRQAVVDFIISRGDLTAQAQFCNMSRYALAKEGRYPRTKAGDEQLRRDVEQAAKRVAA